MIMFISKFLRSLSEGLASDKPMEVGKALTKIFATIVILLAVFPQQTDDGWQIRIFAFLLSPANEIGDTFAGIAGVLAFLWIIITVWLQSQELSEQRKVLSEQKDEFQKTNENMAAQRFEVSFFELLSMLNGIVESIDMVNNNGQVTAKGRDCIKVFFGRLERKFEKGTRGGSELEAINVDFWQQYGHEFGHYFRFLFNSLRVVSESPQAMERHGKLLRSMLSDYELLLLFYNCLQPKGAEMLKYAVEFELFDNLPTEKLLSPDHIALVPEAVFGTAPCKRGEVICTD